MVLVGTEIGDPISEAAVVAGAGVGQQELFHATRSEAFCQPEYRDRRRLTGRRGIGWHRSSFAWWRRAARHAARNWLVGVCDAGSDGLEGVDQYVARARQSIPGRDAIFAVMLAVLEGRVAAAGRVLVVGAGGGEEVVTLASARPDWQITGVDPSSVMLDLAQRRVDAAGLAGSVRLVLGTVEALPPVASERFDGATCILVAHFVPDDGRRAALYASIRTRLATGGSLIVVSGTRNRSDLAFDLHVEAWRHHARRRGAEPDMLGQMVESALVLPMLAEEREVDLLHIAGFSSVVRIYQALLFTGWIALA